MRAYLINWLNVMKSGRKLLFFLLLWNHCINMTSNGAQVWPETKMKCATIWPCANFQSVRGKNYFFSTAYRCTNHVFVFCYWIFEIRTWTFLLIRSILFHFGTNIQINTKIKLKSKRNRKRTLWVVFTVMAENELKAYVMNTFLSPKSIAHTCKSINKLNWIELYRR